ncbi:lysostaphin resistance A-like protein [Bosea sp. (in: a-proteobacteria)]|jgi:hypothetical protein|uniref:CPBP family intramembrane glutamic endopeptidase n=1 Tax=Bosea sp. (in: a-proteobacteria) TaxID=1871050 RepID=UPI00356306FA
MEQGRFNAYVGLARGGRNGVWRVLAGFLAVAIIWIALGIAIVAAGVALFVARSGGRTDSIDAVFATLDYQALAADPLFSGTVLLSFAGIWAGVWLVMPILHRRSVRDLFGVERRVLWSDFLRASLVTFIVGLIAIPFFLLVDPTVQRGHISLSGWLIAAVPLMVCCFVQTSAEEILFRGYLHQTLAARYATPVVWLGVPTILFTVLHWESEASSAINLSVLATIGVFALSMSYLLIKTGNLAAAMGAHFGNNVGAFLLFSSQPGFNGGVLFTGRSIREAGWTLEQGLMLGVIGVGTILVAQMLLVHPASPVRLRSLSRPRPLG